jgi:spermidine/putrescine transport system permease protein/putrescine transport system permease protein
MGPSSAAQRLIGVLAAFAMVCGAVAVLVFVAGLGSGDVTVRRVAGAVIGAAVVWAIVRFVPVARLLGGYSALVYAFLFIPILVVVIYAFNDSRIVTIWDGFTTRWFGEALEDETITGAIGRSLRIALASAVVATVFGTAAAIAMSRAPRRLRVPFDVLVFLTLVVPELVIAISALIFFVNVGFELGLVTMFLAHTIFNASLVMLVVRARFMSMGSTLEEASMDLGASPVATFRQVTLPRLAPAVVAGALLAFTFSFDDVIISNFTAGAGNDTWPLRILSALRFGLSPQLNAAATMMLALTLLGLLTAVLVLRASARRMGGEPVSPGGADIPAPEPKGVPVHA